MDMDIIKRFIYGAKEAYKKVDNHSFNFPITIESAYRLATNIEKLLKEQEAMVKPTKCPCGELFDAKDSSFCPKCGCAYGELSGRYTNIGR
jgi:hypothetical protein